MDALARRVLPEVGKAANAVTAQVDDIRSRLRSVGSVMDDTASGLESLSRGAARAQQAAAPVVTAIHRLRGSAPPAPVPSFDPAVDALRAARAQVGGYDAALGAAQRALEDTFSSESLGRLGRRSVVGGRIVGGVVGAGALGVPVASVATGLYFLRALRDASAGSGSLSNAGVEKASSTALTRHMLRKMSFSPKERITWGRGEGYFRA